MTDEPVGGRHRRVDEPATSPTPAPEQPRVPRHGVLRWIALVTAALCLPAAGALSWLWLRSSDDHTLQSARSQALKAAQHAAQVILSYDYRSIDTDVKRAEALSTGSFETQYSAAAKQLLTDAKQVKIIVQAVVGTAGIEHASDNRVVVLLFVDQASVKQLPNEKSPTTRIDQSRVQMTMSRVHGQWLVSELAAL